ncbi:FxsA family protein [Oryzibacter oryziterrae]|uniref:FxsA family protein n=1 Tax=Oryzibacter oryziterrae TaxID=2766474 RepID=UPI001F31BF20|nr:FxsA family protein [Oryzibacter oryziterrae]
MRAWRFLPLLLILWPLAEIAVFAWVGGKVGVINTIGLVLLAGFGGLALLRLQGLSLMRRIQTELNAGRMPADSMLEGFAVALAGLLLILPGFISDIMALLLLFSPLRKLLIRLALGGMTLTTTGHSATWTTRKSEPGVVDLDADEYTERGQSGPQDPNSPWTSLPKGGAEENKGS